MKAIVKERPGPGFALRDVPEPHLEAQTVIVRVKAVGICGSDMPIFNGVRDVPYPLIPGHEFAGLIAEVGPGVTDWQVGERVTAGLVIGCGTCAYCRRGDEALCDNLLEIGFHVDGAYADYVRVPVGCLHHLPDEMSFVQGASVDPLASSYRGLRRLNMRPEDKVVLFGDGAIGLYALQVIRARGIGHVMVVGHHDNRLEVAAGFGAEIMNNRQEDAVAAVARFTGGKMADLVVEATGAPEVLPAVIDATAKGGTALLLGVFHRKVAFNPALIIRHELRLLGSFCYSWNDFAASLALIHQGCVRTDHVVTHILPLTEMEHALDMLNKRQAIKVILEP